MSDRPQGKHVSTDSSSPFGLGICDKTGFVFHHKDLEKQMEWRGNALVWTGFMVGKPYADKPNEQLRPPLLPPDPVPFQLPRVQQSSQVSWSNQGIPWSRLPVYSWDSWEGSADGIPVAPEDQRLAALQIQQEPSVTYGSAAQPSTPELTQAQILASLKQFHWSA